MKRDNDANKPGLHEVREPLQAASHAPGYVYTSPEVLQREIDEYFMKDWLYVGREEEVPTAGDFTTMTLVGEPIIIARDLDGTLSAYYNMCAHRGAAVAEGSGNTRSFKCPYHGWTYDLKGRLRGARHMKESVGFDVAMCRLKAIRLGVWRRNIFICFSKDAAPLEDFVREFEKDFGFFQMEQCRLGGKVVMTLECNWKLVHENLMDFYHVAVLHANTIGKRFSWNNDGVVLKERGGVSMWYSASPQTPGGEPLLGKMPWLQDRDYSFACEGFLKPNFTFFGRVDCARPWIVWPLSESRSQVIVYPCYAENVFERADINRVLHVYEDFMKSVIAEDRSMIESLQRAMSSRGFEPGRMSVMEKSIHHNLNDHLDRILGG